MNGGGLGRPLAHPAPAGATIAAGANPTYYGDSLFAVVVDQGGLPTRFVLNMPMGVLVAPHDRVAIAFHAGYQFIYEGKPSMSDEGPWGDSFILLGAELMVSLPGHVDLGASLNVPGLAGSRYDYHDSEQLGVWGQVRF
jgi:hypothetical protein